MRGELDDALDRMARMEELNRRRAREHTEQPAGDGSAIDEVIEAVRRVVAHRPRLRVALWAEEGDRGAGVRVEWLNGELIVLPDEEPPPPSTVTPDTVPLPGTPPPAPRSGPATGVPAQPSPPVEPPPTPQVEPPAASNVVVPEPWRPPPPVPVTDPLAGASSSPPASWRTDAEDDDESAARLAELVRRDPSLLRAEDRYRQS